MNDETKTPENVETETPENVETETPGTVNETDNRLTALESLVDHLLHSEEHNRMCIENHG